MSYSQKLKKKQKKKLNEFSLSFVLDQISSGTVNNTLDGRKKLYTYKISI